jgi:Cu+-exporting ATPase
MNTGGSALQEETIGVSGMGCSSCANRIEKSLGGREGVRQVKVDLAGKKVHVTYDKNSVSLTEIEALIEKTGYTVMRTKE